MKVIDVRFTPSKQPGDYLGSGSVTVKLDDGTEIGFNSLTFRRGNWGNWVSFPSRKADNGKYYSYVFVNPKSDCNKQFISLITDALEAEYQKTVNTAEQQQQSFDSYSGSDDNDDLPF